MTMITRFLRQIGIVVGMLLAGLLSPAISRADLIDGDFEFALNFTPSGNYYQSFDGVAGGLTNLDSVSVWTASGTVDVLNVMQPSFPYESWYNTPTGYQFLELNGNSQGSISQTISTEVGKTYSLSFVYSSSGNLPAVDAANVSIAGLNQNLSHQFSGPNPDNPWKLFTDTFVATAPYSTLTFQSLQSGTSGIAIDSVSVSSVYSAVPEPSSALALLMGLAFMLPRRSRRR